MRELTAKEKVRLNEKVIDNFLNICIACGILSIFEKGVENFFIIKKLYN